MGFLKFLKREKKKEDLDELDLPPAPPPLEGFDESMALPEFPDLESEKISATKEFPDFDFDDEEKGMPSMGKDEFNFPPLPESLEKPIAPQPIKPMTSLPEIKPQAPQQVPEEFSLQEPQEQFEGVDIFPQQERDIFRQQKRFIGELPEERTIYIKVNNFKAMLGSIIIIRDDLKKSEETLTKLENIKSTKDKSFDKVRLCLDDLQKKLIFIDKTLFKGE